MLQPYSYIAFDFETTGLDTVKDEPIQIGLVKFDHTGTILETFSSLIKPTKSIKELKTIVRYLTGFTLADLDNAPERTQILQDIKKFFTKDSVLIGHNIGFDIAMLEKYINIEYAFALDTFILSKALIHKQHSYSLDALHTYLTHNGYITPSSSLQAHDALHDSFMSYDVFLYCIKQIQQLRRKHMMIDYVFEHAQGKVANIIKRTSKQYTFKQTEFFLPALHIHATPQPKKILNNTQTVKLPDTSNIRINAESTSLSKLIQSLPYQGKQRVITASHRSKIHLIEQLLAQSYLGFSSLGDSVVLNKKAVHNFFQLKNFGDDEVLFVLKYYSQYDAGHKQLDINSEGDYRIFHALTERKPKQRGHVLVCTHQQLRYHAQKINKTDSILFLDHDRWYNSYNNAHKQSMDPYHMLNLLEQFYYKAQLFQEDKKAQHIEAVSNSFAIFLGVLFQEISQYFLGQQSTTREFSFILDDTRSPKTRGLWNSIKKQITALYTQLSDEEHTALKKQFNLLIDYIEHQTIVEQKAKRSGQVGYVFHRHDIYVDYEEFISSLPKAHYYFITTQNNQKTPVYTLPAQASNKSIITIHTTPQYNKLISLLEQSSTPYCFILSSSKTHSKELFNKFIDNNIHQSHTLVIENVTGGVGKCIAQAQSSQKPLIAVGGYMFYMELIARKFAFPNIYVYYIYGTTKQQIIKDLVRYAT